LIDIAVIIWAHSFLWKILPNSAGQIPWGGSHSAAHRGKIVQIPRLHCGLMFASKLSSILLRNFSYLKAGVVLSYASNIWRKLSNIFSFQKSNPSSHIVFIYNCAILWWLL